MDDVPPKVKFFMDWAKSSGITINLVKIDPVTGKQTIKETK